jgi:DNA-binding NarL/FixJ family response regulator
MIRILIVDDHSFFRRGLRQVCEVDNSFEVVGEAASGQEAVELARALQPDVILMDIQMPGLNGIEATHRITTDDPSARVLILTVQQQAQFVFDAIKVGAQGYLLKDVAERRLIEAVQAIHQGETLIDPLLATRIIEEFRRLNQVSEGVTVLEQLSEGEMSVLRLVAEGAENDEIATRLALTEKTVTNRLGTIYQKLHVNNRTEAALHALRQGWATLDGPALSPSSLPIGRYVHTLNGMIGIIRTEIKMLQMTRENLQERDSELAIVLEKIKEITTQILSLTDEFKLSFSSPETREAISVKTVLTQALSDSIMPESVKIVLEIEDEIPEIQATKNLIDVFRNLSTNAVEAMPEGGSLHVLAKMNQLKNRIEVTFADTGRGIPYYFADLLFQPYSSTKGQKGHGLGLWWSKSYLESIGGNIELLSSEVGKGTSFLVSLPLPKSN